MTHGNRRTIILKKALGLAARHGFTGMTTAALAKSMRVTEPIIYQHFGSKTGLLETLVKETVDQVTQEFTKVTVNSDSPLESLRAIIKAYPIIAEKFQNEFTVINRALVEPISKKMRHLLTRHYEQYADYLASLVAAAQAQNKIRNDIAASEIAWHLIQAALGYLIFVEFGSPAKRNANYRGNLASMVLEGVVNGE